VSPFLKPESEDTNGPEPFLCKRHPVQTAVTDAPDSPIRVTEFDVTVVLVTTPVWLVKLNALGLNKVVMNAPTLKNARASSFAITSARTQTAMPITVVAAEVVKDLQRESLFVIYYLAQ
jgi:hypothetical protein